MKTATKRLISLLASLGVLVASIFVYTILLLPAYSHVNELRGDLAAHKEALADQKKVFDQVKDLIAENQSISVIRENVSRVIPGKEDYPNLVTQLSGLASAAQLRVNSIDMNALPGGNGEIRGAGGLPSASVLQVTVVATGTYQALKDFLSTLERNIRITDLVSLGISVPASGSQNFSYNIVLNSYYQSL